MELGRNKFGKGTLHEKYPYSEFFWSVFYCIRRDTEYSIRMRENTDQKATNTESFYAVIQCLKR